MISAGAIPQDVTDTVQRRYIEMARADMPDSFESKPADTLEEMAEQYRGCISRINYDAAETYNDWAVRVCLDAEQSMPVTKASVIHNNKWVEFRGMVTRMKQPQPLVLEAAYTCSSCDQIIRRKQDQGKPRKCMCGSTQIHENEELSKMVDSQYVTLAEQFEEIRGSRPPRTLECRLDGTLIQTLNPGDRCVMGGVMRLRRKKFGPTYEFLVNNIMQYSPVKKTNPPEITDDIMNRLTDSFGFHIHGNHTIKESVMLLLAGGSKAYDGRSSINMLLVGDPGIAKSTLLKEAAKVAPLGRYTSGRGATAAGLTAGMARDADGVMYMEAGAAVLTDGGVLCVDEFDKTQKADRDALHEVMEQQTASITKLGTMVTLHARVSILAAANPKLGVWDENKTLSDNIDLPDTLLTRFDLIYNLRDVADPDTDRKIAHHMLNDKKSDGLSREEITAYLESVRPLQPTMSPEAARLIEQQYVRARAEPGQLRITPRQLEAIKRLAGARAKIYRHDSITEQDANRAISLVENMIQGVLVDPETGKPDHAKATGGHSRPAVRAVDEAVANMEEDFTAADLVDVVKMSFQDVERALDKLHQQNILMEPTPGVYRVIR